MWQKISTQAKKFTQQIVKKSSTDPAFLYAGCLFAGFHFATKETVLIPVFEGMGLSEKNSRVAAGITRKYVGGAVLGVGSYLYLKAHGKHIANHGISPKGMKKSLVLTATLSPIFVGIVAKNMQQPVMWRYYPEVRTEDFSLPVAAASASAWAAYLAGFEFLFRGFLINHWQEKYSTADSLAMSTLLYTLVHLPNNWREMLACIPMGYVFGGMSLASENMASPYVMHLLISTTSDVMAAKYNPEVRFLG